MLNHSKIEIRHLRYFQCVADELHFSRAALLLGVSQAPLSQQIRQLEDRLGVRLFERTTRNVRLTPAGRVLSEEVRRILKEIDYGLRAAQIAGGHDSGRLNIGSVYAPFFTFLPRAFANFAAKHPHVDIDMQMYTTNEQLALLADRKIDIALIASPRIATGITSREIYRESFVAVLPEGSTLASKKHLEITDLRDEGFIAYSAAVGVRYQDLVMQHFRKAGIRPNIVREVSHTLTILTMVAAGMGVSVAPAWVSLAPMPGVVYRPLPNLPSDVSLVIAWRDDSMNPFVSDFVACTLGAVKAS